MKITKFLFAPIVMCVFPTMAFAQFTGSNASSTMTLSNDASNTFWVSYSPTTFKGKNVTESGYNTFSLGVTKTSLFNGASAMFEYGAFAEWLTKTDRTSGYKEKINLAGIKIPVNLLYRLQLSEISFFPYAGLNIRGYLIGKFSSSYNNKSETVDMFSDKDFALKRINIGYQLGVRAKISNITIGIGYEDMFTSIDDEDTKINGITLSVGFPF